MFDHTNPVSVLVPMLVIALLTFVAFVRMATARGAVASQMAPDFYRAQLGGHEPEPAVIAVRHYHNLLELPTLFYPACIAAFALGAVGTWTLVFAWAYVAARLLQSGIHLSYNNPAHRGGAFVLGVLCMLALWINLALSIFDAL